MLSACALLMKILFDLTVEEHLDLQEMGFTFPVLLHVLFSLCFSSFCKPKYVC